MENRERAVEAWFKAHDAYHRASAAYNERLILVRAERERGNWSMSLDPEYQTLTAAQSVALGADNILYEALRDHGEGENNANTR